MLVIADASPINVLVRIGHVDVLPQLFGEVVIPPAVLDELSRQNTPTAVRVWLASRPAWLLVRAPSKPGPRFARGRGEREAISLARELKADLLLIDDLKGRLIASRIGVTTTGTVGVLEAAAAANLLSLPEAIERLRQTDFRITEEILDGALERDRQRKTPL